MTSCIPPQWLTINGSIDSLSALASLSADSRFIVVKDRDKNYPQQTIKTPGDTGKSFHVSGEIKLKKDGDDFVRGGADCRDFCRALFCDVVWQCTLSGQ